MTTTSDLRGQDIIDSRDILARMDELEGYRDAAIEAVTAIRSNEDNTPEDNESEIWTAEDGTEYGQTSDWSEEEEAEYRDLKGLADEAGCSPDWKYGETLIRDSYFERYAKQLADNLGYTDKNQDWPYDCIDWEKAADQLKQDYMGVTFGGIDYWIRV